MSKFVLFSSDIFRYTIESLSLEASYNKRPFTPAEQTGVTPQGSVAQSWKPGPSVNQDWKAPEPWKQPYGTNKEQQASILHHKQALTSEGSFRFEYASDNGLAAGEVIEPDGSRVGAYQYKDPNGQLVKLKYRAGKEGFQTITIRTHTSNRNGSTRPNRSTTIRRLKPINSGHKDRIR
ncbi:unnamed protein product [Parnassius apollo]|uniref:(apollo) hypothetical protein n=1 Tax=Parnassius apollo TaxID=110799 RepID=A0A8S3YEL9_PARAO|nr:unnamed protein product [Parnassius apollo]